MHDLPLAEPGLVHEPLAPFGKSSLVTNQPEALGPIDPLPSN